MIKRTRSIILVATLLFSMVVLTSSVLAVTNDELDNYEPSYEDPVDAVEDMSSPAWYGTITADAGEVRSGCKVEIFKEKWSPHGWWKIGENTADSSGAYLIVLHKLVILKGHYAMRISDGSTCEIYERGIGDPRSGDWGYGVPIEGVWNCLWSRTTDTQTTDDRTTLTKVVNWVTAFFTGGTSETSATGETPPTDTQTTSIQTTSIQTTDSQTTGIHTMLTKVVNRVAAFVTGGRIGGVLAASETSDGGPSEIPEFTTVAIPVVVLLGLFMLYHRKQKK